MRHLAFHDYFENSSQLAYGCMGLGGSWDQNPYTAEDVKLTQAIVETCLENKINVFDHADIYTFGKAETVFGEVIKTNPKLREKIIIQSKIGIKLAPTHEVKQYDLSPSWISTSLENILSRLNIEQLDVLFLHRPDPLMDLDDTAETLTKLRNQGKFKCLAVSNMHAGQIAWIQAALDFPIIANQLEMSLAHADFVEETITTNTKAACASGFPRGTLEFCEQQNIQIQAWGSLAQGIYSGKNEAELNSTQRATRKLVTQLSNRYSSNPNAIVLAWLMKHPVGIQPVIGTTNLRRIKECAKASKVSLSREDWYLLFETARGNEIP